MYCIVILYDSLQNNEVIKALKIRHLIATNETHRESETINQYKSKNKNAGVPHSGLLLIILDFQEIYFQRYPSLSFEKLAVSHFLSGIHKAHHSFSKTLGSQTITQCFPLWITKCVPNLSEQPLTQNETRVLWNTQWGIL